MLYSNFPNKMLLFRTLLSKFNVRNRLNYSSLHIGGYNSFNQLNQTRRNLTFDYLNLNFVTTPLHSYFAENTFISCFWLIPVSLVGIMDSIRRASFFETDIFQRILFGFNIFNQIGAVDMLNQLKRKNVLPEKIQKKWLNVWELVHSSPQLILLHIPHSGCGEILPRNFFVITRRI